MSKKWLSMILMVAMIAGLVFFGCWKKNPAGEGEDSAPPTPTLSSPPDGATGVTTNLILSWNASSGANSYALQVSTDSSFSSFVVDELSITSTSYTLSGLAEFTLYYWRVRAIKFISPPEIYASGWSNVWKFTTGEGTAPVPPTLSSPDDSATDVGTNPTLSWNASPGANNYTLQVSTESSFSSFVVNKPGITSTSYPVDELAESTLYYWRVNAVNSYGTSDWSSVWSFTTLFITGNWTTYNTSNSELAGNFVNVITIDALDNKWFGTSFGLSKFDGNNWTTYNASDSGLAGDDVEAIAIDALGNKWFGTDGWGVSKFDGTHWTTYNTSNSGLSDDCVLAIAIDASGSKWFGTYSGVSKFDGTNWDTCNTINSGLASDWVLAIAIDSSGDKWFGTAEGVSKFDGDKWMIYNTSNSSLASNFVNAIAVDASGNIWFGSWAGGVTKFDGFNWTTYNTSNTDSGLAFDVVLAIAIDALGNKWFGTDGWGVSKFDGINWTTYNTSNSGLSHNEVRAIAIDASGNKWFGTYGGGVSKFHE